MDNITNFDDFSKKKLGYGETGLQSSDTSIQFTTTTLRDIDGSTVDVSDARAAVHKDQPTKSSDILSRFRNVRYRSDTSWMACCPAHDDKTASLSIRYTDKKWLFFCHAGCSYSEIVSSADLTDEMLGRKMSNRSNIEAIHTYTDESGKYIFESQKIRNSDGTKRITLRTKDKKNIRGIRRVLYNLPAVINRLKEYPDKPLIITEGEKDSDTIKMLTAGSWVATTNPGGAGKWQESYSDDLVRYGLKTALIFADNDDPGDKHAQIVARSLAIRDVTAIIVKFSENSDGGDFSDWLDKFTETTRDESKIVSAVNDIISKSSVYTIDKTDRRYAQLKSEASETTFWSQDKKITDYISQCYYDQDSTHYLMKCKATWQDMPVNRAVASLGLKGIPVRTDPEIIDQQLPDVELALAVIREDNSVDFSGPIAGYKAGVYDNCGKKVLVTSSPSYPTPSTGSHDIIDGILQKMLGDEQKLIFEAAIKLHLEQLYKSIPHHQQIMCLVGPAGSGKSLTQTNILTPLLGGRSARVYKYLSGQDQFNSQIIAAEHLIIEDDSPAFDPRSRNILTVNLTGIAVNSITSVRAMRHQAVNLTAIQLCTLSANPDNINTLPFINESSGDKIMLFKCEKFDMPMPTKTPEDRFKFAEVVRSEIPAYTYYLLNELMIPEDLYGDRYGVITYHNQDIMDLLETQSPEGELKEMIEDAFFYEKEVMRWTGTTSELIYQISLDSRFARRVEKLLPSTKRAGMLLNNLLKRYPDNFKNSHGKRGSVWEISSRNNIKIDDDIQNISVDNLDFLNSN